MIGPVQGSTSPKGPTVTVQVHDINIAGASRDILFQALESFIHQRVQDAFDDFPGRQTIGGRTLVLLNQIGHVLRWQSLSALFNSRVVIVLTFARFLSKSSQFRHHDICQFRVT